MKVEYSITFIFIVGVFLKSDFDDIFLINTTDATCSGTTYFLAANFIYIPLSCWDYVVSFSTSFVIAGSVSNDGTFTYDRDNVVIIYDEAYGVNNYARIEVNEAVTSEDGLTVTITNPDIDLRAERNENFSTVLNVPDQDSMYNLRYTLRRAYYNWGVLLNSILRYNPITNIIKNTFFKNNGALTTKLDSDETCVGGDTNKAQLREDGNFQIAEVQEAEMLFEPNLITFKQELTQTQIDFIKDAHENKLSGYDLDKNYGYLKLIDERGEVHYGYLLEMSWNILNRFCTFKCRKRRISIYSVEQADEDLRLLENGSVRLLEDGGRRLLD